MGYVAACTHLQLQETVALKLLRPEIASEPEAVSRFLREAQAAARIRSEHIVRVYDVGTLDDGSPYMVMEYLRGMDLTELLHQGGPLSISEAVDYLLQGCEALAEAHSHGIVHRDLKPANLFLAELPGGGRSIKVLDFGISKLNPAGAAVARLTSTKAMLGTPYYMAPEQLTSARTVDPRADVWALGIVLYELLSGDVPFGGETLAELCVAVLQAAPTPLSTKRLDVPLGVWTSIERCLQKDREQRFSNVAELAVAIGPYGSANAASSVNIITRLLPSEPSDERVMPMTLRGEGPAAEHAGSWLSKAAPATGSVGLHPARLRAGEPAAVVTGPTSWAQTGKQRRHSALPIVLAVAGLVATLGAGVFWWLSSATSQLPVSVGTAADSSGSTSTTAELRASEALGSPLPQESSLEKANRAERLGSAAPTALDGTDAPTALDGTDAPTALDGTDAPAALAPQPPDGGTGRAASASETGNTGSEAKPQAKGTVAPPPARTAKPAVATRPPRRPALTAASPQPTAPPKAASTSTPAATSKPASTTGALNPETMIDDRR